MSGLFFVNCFLLSDQSVIDHAVVIISGTSSLMGVNSTSDCAVIACV